MRRYMVAIVLTLGVAGCGQKEGPAPATAPSGPAPSAPSPTPSAPDLEHGAAVELGVVTIAGHEFSVRRLGEVVPGKEAAFEIALVQGPKGADLAKLNVYAWVEQKDGVQVSAPSKGAMEQGHLHFHVTPKATAKDLQRVVVRLRAEGGIDERASLPLDGHGHEHGATPHDGVVASFQGPDAKRAGHLELKLHDDKGDLELWLAQDAAMSKPFDLPLDAVVRVEFIDVGKRTVELRVRNAGKNEDEDGTANVRDSRTNYFVFPGETGADAAWLVGATFSSVVRVTFQAEGKSYVSEELMLVPHTHADGSTHE